MTTFTAARNPLLRAAVFVGLSMIAMTSRAQTASLFERLGGEPVMTRVMDQTVDTMVRDPDVAETLRGINLRVFAHKLYLHLCATTGGPCVYTGETLHAVHDGMHVTKAELDVASAALAAALDANGVGEREKNELLQLRASMRKEIEAPSTATARR